MPRTILLSGAGGLIGQALTTRLKARGDHVVALVRRKARGDDELSWNPERGDIDRNALESPDAIVNLAGENIGAARWTPERKRAILDSRLNATRLLAGLAAGLPKPGVFLSASAIGIYGFEAGNGCTETRPRGAGFLAEVCAQWEAAAQPAQEAGWRLAYPRFAPVLAREGGLLPRLLTPGALGLGAILGSGNHWQSFVHIDDAVAALLFILDTESLEGPANIAAPEALRQADFARSLAKHQGRPLFLRAPRFMLTTLLGEMARELLLADCAAMPAALSAAGFSFAHPTLDSALADLLPN